MPPADRGMVDWFVIAIIEMLDMGKLDARWLQNVGGQK
jgi:hypothetical protein